MSRLRAMPALPQQLRAGPQSALVLRLRPRRVLPPKKHRGSQPAPTLRVLGLMSGTSADGIDVALVHISGVPPDLSAQLENFTAVPYAPAVRSAILRIGEGGRTTSAEISQLNFALGKLFAQAVRQSCRKFRVPVASVDLIGSHGQTIYHQGQAAAVWGVPAISATLQVGEPSVIANLTGVTTVGDFRPADIAAGGQGAPLVPFVDYLMYRHERIGRAALNIGGIANVTVISAAARPEQVFAFDTGPGNMIIDALTVHATRGKRRFDRGSKLALQGQALPELLDELLADPYFRQPPPKSAGREQYGASYVERFLRWGQKHRASPQDLIRTATLLTALTVTAAWNRFIRPRADIRQLLVSGGGARNPLLMALLAGMLAGVSVQMSDELGIPGRAKEALAFAVLAYESLHRRPANLPAATGAERPVVLGKICYASPR
jgi:anhydro-N-acetylmuramic acid kinase